MEGMLGAKYFYEEMLAPFQTMKVIKDIVGAGQGKGQRMSVKIRLYPDMYYFADNN